MENNHIDQQFNEASQRSEEPTVFPGFDKVWEKVEEKLDQKKEKKKIIPVWFPYGIAASLMIGMGALYFLNKKDTLEQAAQPQIAEQKVLPKPTIDTHIAKIDRITKGNIQKEKNKISTTVEEVVVYDNVVPEPLRSPNLSSVDLPPPVIKRHMETSDKVINIDEIAMVGYKPKVKTYTTGAVSVITTGIVSQPSVENALQGRVAGIQITAAGSGRGKNDIKNASNNINSGYFNNNQIMIRGIASINPGDAPLYIINGKIEKDDYFRSLDPNKVESINVLKGISATAIYGSSAANGAVIVTTKNLSRREKKRMEKLQKEIIKQKQISPVSHDEAYDDFVENPFELTQSQPLSTFSIDVDNASYSNVRRMINSGQKVDKNAVRIEEMINYFKYNYPQPKTGDSFSINTEYSGTPWNPDHQLLKIGLQGKSIPKEQLPASNLVFLIDVSGSMDAVNKLPLLKSSFKVLLDQLRPKDKVGIVVYAGSAGEVLPPTSAGEKDKIIQALDHLQAGGSTAGGAGIELAYKLAQENFIKDGNNRVIIATDGDFNVGMSSTSDLKTLIEDKRKEGVFLTCLGFGMGNYKDNTLETLADKGNGNYAYIDNLQEANKFLGKEFAGSMYAIAKDVKIQIEFNPEYVKSYRLIGYENRKLKNEDFINDKIDAGELGSGHTVTALYEIIPTGVHSSFLPTESDLKYTQNTSSKAFGDELATIKFRYKKPNEDTSKEISQIVKNTNSKMSSSSPDFKFASSVAWFGLVLRESKLIKNKDLKKIEDLAKQGRSTDTEGYRAEFIRLVESYKATHP
ncbi:MAG: YfbK domain-containing protein [Chryseobacterium jejuense]|uniref:vWA domain-containing protein n=1 Tax=Chryseobacterium jejuense TaxID=445960 RepID=UPI003D099F4A